MTVKLPIAKILDTGTRGLAVTAITGYQRFISPHKGFSCAHRVLYGCDSCSQYFKRVIAEEGIFTAIANAKGRFRECREANEILKMRRAERRARCRQNCRNPQPENKLEPNYSASRDYRYAQAKQTRGQRILAIDSNSDNSEPPSKQPDNFLDDFEDFKDFKDLPDFDSDLEPQGLDDLLNSNSSEESDSSEELGDSDNPQSPNPLGGSQWAKKRRSQANNSDANASSNNNCNDCADCANCADALDVINVIPSNCGDERNCDNPLDGCSPDLNCGDADCLSGMDCSGCDLGGADCSGCGDCGSCG
ncbi:membrane protein insertion efficiency factor YidD [Pseudanabaena sp. FACHB-1998]|uniref:membrane protein insertion efficiency factor YidD n=1 Tax=Pseudanabaena sp. FACHB-1998 TaxID=2692858 RepID=UPI00168192D1|nr:membrane protein insertion efficiency factor YidD [Pseudanabaena sp. FACHB-1998]MBD2175899.1 membrane protein insertion efficiency factor YidD [Pseudanabaena sp. FACHB-1998]